MNREQINYKLFNLDKAVKQLKQDQDKAKAKLPRVYKLTPDKLEDLILTQTKDSIKSKIKKELNKDLF